MCNTNGESNKLISPHEIYSRLGRCDQSRRQAYASLFETILNRDDVQVIRNAARFSMPTGDNRFKQQIEHALNRKVGYAHRGRPRKSRMNYEK